MKEFNEKAKKDILERNIGIWSAAKERGIIVRYLIKQSEAKKEGKLTQKEIKHYENYRKAFERNKAQHNKLVDEAKEDYKKVVEKKLLEHREELYKILNDSDSQWYEITITLGTGDKVVFLPHCDTPLKED